MVLNVYLTGVIKLPNIFSFIILNVFPSSYPYDACEFVFIAFLHPNRE